MTELPAKRGVTSDAVDLLASATHTDVNPAERGPRPSAITGGAILVWLRALGGLLWLAGFARALPEVAHDIDLSRDEQDLLLGIVVTVDLAWVILLAVMAWLVLLGSNAARMLVMAGTTLSITAAALAYFSSGEEITVRTTLLTLTLDILILLALSSKDARAWSRGRRRSRRKGGSESQV